MKDLLVLTADKDAECLIKAFLDRIIKTDEVKKFTFHVLPHHPQRDPGVLNHSVDYVRPYLKEYKFLLVLFDHEGCGKESASRDKIETQIEKTLDANGWKNRNACVVLEPEIESWLWVNAAHLHDITDWSDKLSVYGWLKKKGFLFKPDGQKPEQPKEAFECILKKQRIPYSSSLFAELAGKASYISCSDPAFSKFIDIIRNMQNYEKN